MTRSLVSVADRHCQGKVVSVLEGGYNLRALGTSAARHLIGLNDDKPQMNADERR
jgi:acetoin utilization deacetylase AcuC-like enzyme